MAVTIDGTLGVTTPTGTGDVSVGDDLIFTGTGNRITGDFSNATIANRVLFQTSTANSSSFVGHLPNGTGQASGAFFYAGSDPANTSALQIRAGLDNSQVYIASAATGTGTYLPLTFYTGATERVRIDTSGNVLVGTATTRNKLTVAGTSGNAPTLGTASGTAFFCGGDANYGLLQGTSSSGWSWLQAQRVDGTATAYDLILQPSGGNVGIGTSSPARRLDVIHDVQYQFRVGTSAGNSYDIGRSPTDGLLYFYGNQNGFNGYVFSGANGERMRIDSSGNLLVGTTGNAFGAKTVVAVGSSPALAARFSGAGGAGTGFNSIYDNTTGTAYGVVFYYNGTANQPGAITYTSTTTTYSTSSDYRLKENVQPMQNALATVAQLKPVTYTWKADGSDGQGFIAHELQAVVPDAVTGEKDAVDDEGKPVYQGVDTSFLVATLTAAIQEQQAIIKSLQDRITALEQA